MSRIDEALDAALSRDGLAEAEKLTGRSYKDSSLTQALGFAAHLDASAQRDAILSLADDTTFSMGLDEYLRVVRDEGFELALSVPFTGKSYDGEPAPSETFYVFWHPKHGILLRFDTYGGSRISGGNFYYNIDFPDSRWPEGRVTSSGGFSDNGDGTFTFVGNHDCREGLRFHIRQLRKHGTFVNPWRHRGFLWLCHYADETGNVGSGEHRRIADERIAMMPEHIRKAITP
jgi:hypothetical protein